LVSCNVWTRFARRIGVDVVEVAVSVGVHRSTVHGWVGPVDQVSAWRALPMPQDLSNNAISTVVA